MTVSSNKTSLQEFKSIEAAAFLPNMPGIADNINKDKILTEYTDSCRNCGIEAQVATTTKGEIIQHLYPRHHQLIKECTMRPSRDLQYRVTRLWLEDVIVEILKAKFLEEQDLKNLEELLGTHSKDWTGSSPLYKEMISDFRRLENLDFSMLKAPRLDYANQQRISQYRVDLATAGLIHYGMHPGMLLRYMKGEYTGESRSADAILEKVSPYIEPEDARHIHRIITQGCPSQLNFEEDTMNKLAVIEKGNQQTFEAHPEVVEKTMNKEEKNSHVLPFRRWVVYFSPFLRCTPQGMREKYGKYRVIFDSSTQTWMSEVVLNHVTTTEWEANIDFGKSKINFLINIYNWRVSFPREIIYVALADITACFRFPRLCCDITGAFGFMAQDWYFISTSHVFGSNTSASSWEPLRRAIKNLIPIFFERDDLIIKHKKYIDMLKWHDEAGLRDPTPAKSCYINRGVLDSFGNLIPPTAEIYVDDIMQAAVSRGWIIKSLAATIEAIFTVCGVPDIDVRQCPLSLEKWLELILGWRQTVLGLIVDSHKLTVGISDEYLKQVRELLKIKWHPKRKFFRVSELQKLIGKLGRIGEGAPWIYKLMSHLYTSLAFSLKSNDTLLRESSSEFKALIHQIRQKQFIASNAILQREVCYAMKMAAKMVNHHKMTYPVNETMSEELNFLQRALQPESNIKFETPIAHMIPREPTASLFGDSSLTGCGGYSLELKFWWHIDFPIEIVERTLLHIPDESDVRFISINCLEYFTIIINYCAAKVYFATVLEGNDPYPIVLCVTDNTSAKKWTTHTSKKSLASRALARFFCGLLIGSNVGINATWISTKANELADKISRLKKEANSNNSSSTPTFDYSKLQQDHPELKACASFHPSQLLISFLWEVMLSRKCPDLNKILQLEPQDLGKLCT
jgi:hypothetical protein